MKILAILFLMTGTAQAKTVLSTVAACSSSELHNEPLALRGSYVEAGVKNSLNSSPLFNNPESLKDLFSKSGINRAGVSSSHIVNLISEGLERLNRTESELIKKGELLPLHEGVTYGEAEYARRQDSVNRARAKYFLPMLQNLYNTYLGALQQDRIKDTEKKDPAAAKAFYGIASRQRQALTDLIRKYRPAILQKLGEIDVVTETQDLPFSYKDGYMVKIRFKKAGSPYHVTIYPRMLLTLAQNQDDQFLQALNRWKEFTESQWKAANNLKKSRISYSWSRVMEWVGGTSPDNLVRKEPLMKKAYAQASEDVRQAKFVHEQTEKLTQDEIYFLFDVMRALRGNDLPMCNGVIRRLNASMTKMLQGKKSSSQLNALMRAKAESFATQVVFYQDQYLSFSSAASAKLGEKR